MELMVTLAVVAILVTVAIPGFGNLIRDNRLITSTNRLVTSLAHARSEAVKRGTPVSICASNNGTSCTGGSWNEGWLVFSDGGTTGTVDGTDTILRVEEPLTGGLAVTVTGNNSATFQPTGFAVAECDERCGPIPMLTAAPRPALSHIVATLLPGHTAHAGNGRNSTPGTPGNGNTGSGGTTDGEQQVATTATVTEFTLCDGRSGETGRRISLWATGRFGTSAVSCGG